MHAAAGWLTPHSAYLVSQSQARGLVLEGRRARVAGRLVVAVHPEQLVGQRHVPLHLLNGLVVDLVQQLVDQERDVVYEDVRGRQAVRVAHKVVRGNVSDGDGAGHGLA